MSTVAGTVPTIPISKLNCPIVQPCASNTWKSSAASASDGPGGTNRCVGTKPNVKPVSWSKRMLPETAGVAPAVALLPRSGLDGFATPTKARNTPSRKILNPTTTRTLMNADREVDFFCINRLQPTPLRLVLCEIRESVTRKLAANCARLNDQSSLQPATYGRGGGEDHPDLFGMLWYE